MKASQDTMRIDDFLAEVGLAVSSQEKYEDWLLQLQKWIQDEGYSFKELTPKFTERSWLLAPGIVAPIRSH